MLACIHVLEHVCTLYVSMYTCTCTLYVYYTGTHVLTIKGIYIGAHYYGWVIVSIVFAIQLRLSKPDIAMVTHGNCACALQKHMALIDKDGHNFGCSSVRFEAYVEFSAKSLHKQR